MNSKPYILYADDILSNYFLVAKTLAEEFDFSTSPTGAECIRNLEVRQPDLLIIGDSMPIQQDKHATEDFIKLYPQFNKIPILFVSSGTCERPTIDDNRQFFITEPIDKKQLARKIKQLVSK